MPSHRRLVRPIARGIAYAAAGFLAVLLIGVVAGAYWLTHTDLKPIVEREATEALGRQITLDSFAVRWGDPLAIDLTGLAIANAPWGSKPEMVRVGKLSALLDVSDLLHGVLRYERLRIADATIVLERNADGTGNWKYGGSAGPGGLGLVPKDRTQFPTLIDFIGERGLITYRTRSGNILTIALDTVAISSPSDDAPVRLMADGAYNDAAVRLETETESFIALRDTALPFGTRFTMTGKDTDIAFNGAMQEPLDFEGVHGELSIDARTLNDVLRAMQSQKTIDLPLKIAGNFDRAGDHWSLQGAKGQLNAQDFTGNLALLEGRPGEPDDIALDLDLGEFNADALGAAVGGGKKASSFETWPLHPEGLDAVNLTADLATPRLTVAGKSLRTVTLHGRLAAGDVTLKQLSFALGGGTLMLSGALAGKDKDSTLGLKAQLSGAEAGEIARELGGAGDEIRGRLDGTATLALRGATVGDGLKSGDGAALLTLRTGDVARSLIETLSSDLRALFRSKEGRVPVTCMAAALTVKDGVGVLSPLRLESKEAIVIGAGKVDLAKRSIDLTLKTERDSTSFFALDIPVRISGPLAKPSVTPLVGSNENWLDNKSAVTSLPGELRTVARTSPCLQ